MVRTSRCLHHGQVRHEYVCFRNGRGTETQENSGQRPVAANDHRNSRRAKPPGGEEMVQASRKPEIMGDAAHAILTRSSRMCTGNFFVDDEVLKAEGVADLSSYAVDPDAALMPDFFI